MAPHFQQTRYDQLTTGALVQKVLITFLSLVRQLVHSDPCSSPVVSTTRSRTGELLAGEFFGAALEFRDHKEYR